MRWIIRLVVVLVVLVVFAIAALFLLPADRIAKLVTDQFEAATGRVMTIEGDVRPSLWPEIGINTGAISIANADWASDTPMLRAENLSVGVDIGALIGRKIRVKRIEAVAPEVLLEVASDGRANWEIGGTSTGSSDSSDTGTASALPNISLDLIKASDGKVTFVDHASGARYELAALQATATLPDLAGTGGLELQARMNSSDLSVKTTLEGVNAFLTDGAVPVSLEMTVGGSKVGFAGRAGLTPLAADGQIDVNLSDMASVFQLAGMSDPKLPLGLGRTVVVTGAMTFTEQSGLALRGTKISLDHNHMSGDVDLSFTDRPKLTAKLAAGSLDFSAAFPDAPVEGAETTQSTAEGWSHEPIDVSGLQAMDAAIAMTADTLDLGYAMLGRTEILTTLDRGRAVTEIKEMRAYDGSMSGTVVVNSRGGLSTRAQLRGDAVALEPLMRELAGWDRLQATGDVAINILGVGNDMHTLMNSLSGDGSVRLGKGELRGLDLVGMLRNLDPSFVGAGAKTILDSISATFTVESGVLKNEDLSLLAPLLTSSGNAIVSIGAQDLDFRLVPALLGDGASKGLKVPVIVSGKWSNPRFRIDLEALAQQELGDEIEAVKAQAEEAVKAKVEEELGVKIDDLGNVEDAVKDELEDRIKKGVLDLLGGN